MLPSALDTMAELLSGNSLSALIANVSVYDEPAETGRCRLFAPCGISMGVLALFAGLPFCIWTARIPAGEAEVGRSRAARSISEPTVSCLQPSADAGRRETGGQ